MRRPRREPWSFWCVLKCSVNCPIRSLSKAICTSGLPVSLGCVPYWSMRDFLCSLANTCLVHSCLISIVVCDVYRVPRSRADRKGWPRKTLGEQLLQIACTVYHPQYEYLFFRESIEQQMFREFRN